MQQGANGCNPFLQVDKSHQEKNEDESQPDIGSENSHSEYDGANELFTAHTWSTDITHESLHICRTYEVRLSSILSSCLVTFRRFTQSHVYLTAVYVSADMKECLRLAERLADLSVTIFSSKKHAIESGLLVLHAVNDCLSPHFCLCDVPPTV